MNKLRSLEILNGVLDCSIDVLIEYLRNVSTSVTEGETQMRLDDVISVCGNYK